MLQLSDHSIQSSTSCLIPRNALGFAVRHHNDVGDVLKRAQDLLPALRPLPSELHGVGSVDNQVKHVSKPQLTLNMTARPPCKTHSLSGIAANPGARISPTVPSVRHACRWIFFPPSLLSETAACALSSSRRTSCHVHFRRSKSKSAWPGACFRYCFRVSSRSLDTVGSYHMSFKEPFKRTYEISFDW